MSQLIIADLPDEVETRLRERAAKSGRTVEAEIRSLLTSAMESPPSLKSNEPFATSLTNRVRAIGLTEEAWEELDRSLEAIRGSRHDSIHRWLDFSGPEWDD